MMVQKTYMLGDLVEYRGHPFESWKRGVVTSRTISANPVYSVRTDEGTEVHNLSCEQLRADEVRLAGFRRHELGDAA